MTATAIIGHVRKHLGVRWSHMPCGAREAARGLAALMHRAGDAGFRGDDDMAGLGLVERVAWAADVRGAEQLREIEDGVEWLLARDVVRVGEDDVLAFAVPPRPVRGRAGGGAAAPARRSPESTPAPGEKSALRARTGAMNVAVRGLVQAGDETGDDFAIRKEAARATAGAAWDQARTRRDASVRAQASILLPVPGGRDMAGRSNLLPGQGSNGEATIASGGAVASAPAASGFASGLLPRGQVAAAAASRDSDASEAAAAAPCFPPAGACEATGEANPEASNGASVASSQRDAGVGETARMLGREAVEALKLEGVHAQEAAGIVQQCLEAGYTVSQVRDTVAKKAESSRPITSASVILAVLRRDSSPAGRSGGVGSGAAAPAPTGEVRPEVLADPEWSGWPRRRQEKLSYILTLLFTPDLPDCASKLSSRYITDKENFLSVAARHPEIWEAAGKDAPDQERAA